jgi:hypothetical protein
MNDKQHAGTAYWACQADKSMLEHVYSNSACRWVKQGEAGVGIKNNDSITAKQVE